MNTQLYIKLSIAICTDLYLDIETSLFQIYPIKFETN